MPELTITSGKRRVLRLPRNTRGRDLIITDPHGAYDLVWAAMKAANLKDVSIEALEELAATFDDLPFVIEVETSRGLVGIVHADVPPGMDWQTFTAKIEAGDEYATRMALGMDISDSFHESRQRVQNRRADGVPGIGRVFVGHTVLFEGMQKLGNLYAIDSGSAWADAGKDKGHLTMVDPRMQTMYLAQPPAARDDRRLDLRIAGEIPAAPFSGCDEPSPEDAESPRM